MRVFQTLSDATRVALPKPIRSALRRKLGAPVSARHISVSTQVPCSTAKALEQRLIIPVSTDTEEETTRASLQDRGQFLARQERWEDLSQEIREADSARCSTQGGMPHAELLAMGARGDVVQAAEDAIYEGVDPTLSGIEALEEFLTESPEDYAIALVVAHSHMDIGWSWRGVGWREDASLRNDELFHAHFRRAERVLELYCGLEEDAPAIAAARCALLAARERPQDRVADDYEDLIDLDVTNPRPMRAMGNHLLPRWFGSYQQLELEARRTASRTGDIWGAGAYAWVYLDALTVDVQAAEYLDVEFFIDGMRDILERRDDQHTVNVLAAFAALTMSPDRLSSNASADVKLNRQALHETFDWLLSEHLCEVHPLVWAQASIAPDPRAPMPARGTLMARGHMAARQIITSHFHDELARGTTITFSRHGMRHYPAL